MKKYIKSAFASRDYIITIGALQSVCITTMKAKIYDTVSEQVVWDGYLDDALNQYPDLKDCEVLNLQTMGSQKLSIQTRVPFDFEPAW